MHNTCAHRATTLAHVFPRVLAAITESVVIIYSMAADNTHIPSKNSGIASALSAAVLHALWRGGVVVSCSWPYDEFTGAVAEIAALRLDETISTIHYPHKTYKKLSCRRETARCFVSLKILLSHSRSFKVIRNCTND